jgi:hypothetical protein
VREESHLDDMRQAIRGDFDRLAARRGEQELLRVCEPAAPEEPLMEPTEAPASEELEPVHDLPRRSWLSRMLST